MKRLPIAISIPHGGTRVPEEFQELVIATEACTKEDIDHLTREVFSVPRERVIELITFDYSRTFVDLNRPPDSFGTDSPDGVVKRRTHLDKPVFSEFPSDECVARVLRRTYHPYHERLSEIAKNSAVRLILDCHSMAPFGLPVSPDAGGQERPPICLGHKGGATAPRAMIEALRDSMAEVYGVSTGEIWIDRPFNGGYITRTYGGAQMPVIQIEFSRGFYMSEHLEQARPEFSQAEVERWSTLFLTTLENFAARYPLAG